MVLCKALLNKNGINMEMNYAGLLDSEDNYPWYNDFINWFNDNLQTLVSEIPCFKTMVDVFVCSSLIDILKNLDVSFFDLEKLMIEFFPRADEEIYYSIPIELVQLPKKIRHGNEIITSQIGGGITVNQKENEDDYIIILPSFNGIFSLNSLIKNPNNKRIEITKVFLFRLQYGFRVYIKNDKSITHICKKVAGYLRMNYENIKLFDTNGSVSELRNNKVLRFEIHV